MQSHKETLYLKSPAWLQNALVTLYGYGLERERHAGVYDGEFSAAVARARLRKPDLDAYTQSAIARTVSEAGRDVPYYRTAFEQAAVDVSSIRGIEDLRRLPLLEKTSLRRDPDALVSEKYRLSDCLTIHTTGTTGTPLRIRCTPRVRQVNYAYYDRFLAMNGIAPRARRATLGGRIVVSERSSRPPFWRYSAFQKNLLMSSYHLSESNVPFYIERLRSYAPDVIDSYPSSLYTIARYAQERGISLAGVARAITTSAETLFPDQRAVIESVFGVTVYDQYGAAEMCVFVGQCGQGSYHLHTDYGVIEILREDGVPAGPGEDGEIVCTGFINDVMPLIRYRIGDRGALSARDCPCGSPFPVLERLIGRMDDSIVTPDGRRVGRLSPVFKGFPVREVQYVQRTVETLDVNVVKDSGYTEESERLVLVELEKRLGPSILIRLHYVPAIEKGKGGKLKSVVSLLGSGPPRHPGEGERQAHQ